MRVIQTIAGIQDAHGGTSRSVPALCEALAQHGIEVHLVVGRPSEASTQSRQPGLTVQTHWIDEPGISGRLFVGNGFRRVLTEVTADSDKPCIIHDHGIWLPSNHTVAKFASARNVVRIVSPRGMLSSWAMNNGYTKKRMAWRLFQHRDLQQATAFHATSELEADEIQSLGLRQPIAIIPNGINLCESSKPRLSFENRRCLFLSRIHPIKGLRMLLDAWRATGPPNGWKLIIAGTDENRHTAELRQFAKQLGLGGEVEFYGAVDDESKWHLYRSADLFVLPSFSENFGLVVAEALASEVPVITTTGTPWQTLQKIDAGWWVEPNTDAIASALDQATRLPTCRLREMGLRGGHWARSEFKWESVAERMQQFYLWLLKRTDKPCFVK